MAASITVLAGACSDGNQLSASRQGLTAIGATGGATYGGDTYGGDTYGGSGGGSGLDAGVDTGPGSGSGSDAGPGSGGGSDAGPGSGGGSDAGPGSGGGSDAGTCSLTTTDPDDICVELRSGLVDPSEVGQDTLDACNCAAPAEPDCVFTPVPNFYAGATGCNVTDAFWGDDLGNYSFDCPTDIYQQQDLCAFAQQAFGPARSQPDAEPWTQAPGGDELPDSAFPSGFDYPNPGDDGVDPSTGAPAYVGEVTPPLFSFPGDAPPNDFVTFQMAGPRPLSEIDFLRQNEFQNPMASSTGRNVVVLGSSMMSTHNQTQNGKMCSRASTRADRRGLVGNDFLASPAWNTRVPWRRALALGRTGFATGDVSGAVAGTVDACQRPWRGPVTPIQAGVNWLTRVGIGRGLMVTEGGLINDQKSRAGGWSETLGGLVACNAMDRLVPALNAVLNAEHLALNPRGVRVNGRVVPRRPPIVRFVRQAPAGMNWAAALDVAPPVRAPRCWYAIADGNGRNPLLTFGAISAVEKEVPPLVQLSVNTAPAAVPVNLRATRAAYLGPDIKQIWLQYPYMDTANVTLRGSDLKLLWPAGVGKAVIDAWGAAVAVTFPAIDAGSAPRIRQVTDDLNELMYATIGCNAAAPFRRGHPALVCARNNANAPRVVVTQDAFPGWGAADHQDTVIGGMPHESAGGANKMGAAVVAADALP